MGGGRLNDLIEDLNNYIGKKGKDPYKSHKHAILAFDKRDRKTTNMQEKNGTSVDDEEQRTKALMAEYQERKDLGAGQTPEEDEKLRAILAKKHNLPMEVLE